MSLSQNGWICFRHQQLEIQDPSHGGSPALLDADDSVLVFVNETPISSPTEVFSRTSIRITLPHKTLPDYDFELEISPDHLKAYVRYVEYEPGFLYTLPETEPAPQLKLYAKKTPATPADYPELLHDLKSLLKTHRIGFGWQEARFEQVLQSPGQRFCVAKGIPAQVRKGPLVLIWDYGLPLLGFQKYTLNQPLLKPVVKGTQVAKIQESKLLSEGKNIFGRSVHPPLKQAPLDYDTSAFVLKASFLESTQSGIPDYRGKQLQLYPFERVSQALPDSQELSFAGAACVPFNVQQKNICVQKDFEVLADLSRSYIRAQGHIFAHQSVIKSRLLAGGDPALDWHIKRLLYRFESDFKGISEGFSDLSHLQQKPAAQTLLLNQWIRNEYPEFQNALEHLKNTLQGWDFFSTPKNLRLKLFWQALEQLKKSQLQWTAFQQWQQALQELLRTSSEERPPAYVIAHYVQGSDILSQGVAFVTGEGCYNSKIYAQRGIFITGEPGYFREGTLASDGHIVVRALGSPNGSRVKVYLGEASSLFAEHIYPGVDIYVAQKLVHQVTEPLSHKRIYSTNEVQIMDYTPEEYHDFWF